MIFQLTTAIEAEAREGPTLDAADLYAQYHQYAQNVQQAHVKPSGHGPIKKQDLTSDVESVLGPDAAVSNSIYKHCVSKQIYATLGFGLEMKRI